jgi:hypothetical protein
MNICYMEIRGFINCGMGVGSGPNPVYSPEILFFVAITAVSALAYPCRYASVGITYKD